MCIKKNHQNVHKGSLRAYGFARCCAQLIICGDSISTPDFCSTGIQQDELRCRAEANLICQCAANFGLNIQSQNGEVALNLSG